MSTVAAPVGVPEQPRPKTNYLNADNTIKGWLLTTDHKRIAILYLISITFMFAIGSVLAGLIRIELTSPVGRLLESESYNKVFTEHRRHLTCHALCQLQVLVGSQPIAQSKLRVVLEQRIRPGRPTAFAVRGPGCHRQIAAIDGRTPGGVSDLKTVAEQL